MASDLIIRFLIGGFIVSLFSVVGQLFEPTTFSGIFGAAPSVALASLSLAALQKGHTEVARQSHAMLFGAIALTAYSVVVALVIKRVRLPAWLEAGLTWTVWLAVAALLWALFSRS